MDIFDLDGQKIRIMRESLNWSRGELAGRSEVPEGTLTDIELGKTKNPGLETMKSLIKAFPREMTANLQKKADLLVSLYRVLPVLNEEQLGSILDFATDPVLLASLVDQARDS